MRTSWDRVAAIVFSGTAWALALVAGPHLAHAAIGRRRDLG